MVVRKEKKKIAQTKETDLDILYNKAIESVSKPTRTKIAVYILSISPKWRSEGYAVLAEELNKLKGEEKSVNV